MSMNKKKVIPIFFASDNNYAPYLAVTLKSLLANASSDYFYKIYVLTSNISEDKKERIKALLTENSSIEFCDVKDELEKIRADLQLRDYYSLETYYRFFIDSLFPQYDKVIYLDCDIIVKGDISKFYNTNIKNYLVAAVPEQVMQKYKEFSNYVEKALDVKTKNYFNAGVLLINTKMFRAYNIKQRFSQIIKSFKFRVTQDEDYLNVLCKNKVKYLDYGWNKMPFDDAKFNTKKVNLIHYNLNWKPWHYKHILFEDDFWYYASLTDFYKEIKEAQKNYTFEQKMNDIKSFENLKLIAVEDTNDPSNYKNTNDRILKGHYLKKSLKKISSLKGLSFIFRFFGTQGYKLTYGYRNRKRQRKTISS